MDNLKFVNMSEIIKGLIQYDSYEDYPKNRELKKEVNEWFTKIEINNIKNLDKEDTYIKKLLKKISEIETYQESQKEDQELKELKSIEKNQLINYLKDYSYGKFIFDNYKNYFVNKSLKERMNIILNTIGLDQEDNCIYSIMCELIKYVVCIQKNTNIICLGDKATGKSFLYGRILNDKFIEKRSEMPTVAELRGNKKEKYKLLKSCIFDKKVFVVDELSSDAQLATIAELKKVLEDKEYNKADIEKNKTEISIVLNGNKYNVLDSFKKLNKKYLKELYSPQFNDGALLDRFSALLYHSNKLMGENIYISSLDKEGISIIQFQGIIQYLREQEYTFDFSDILETGRGSQNRKNKHIIKIVTGLLKLLYPENEKVPKYVIKGFVEFALHFISLTQKDDNDNDVYNPFSEKLSEFLIELYKEPEEEIEDSFFLKNRFYFKVKDKNYCKKIALTGFGIEDNKNEIELINKNMNNDKIAKVINNTKFYNILTQENKFKIIYNRNKENKEIIDNYNELLLENIECHALLGSSISNKKFIGIPNFMLNQLNTLAQLELTKILKEDIRKKIQYVYGYDNKLELVNILEAKN